MFLLHYTYFFLIFYATLISNSAKTNKKAPRGKENICLSDSPTLSWKIVYQNVLNSELSIWLSSKSTLMTDYEFE